MNTSMGGLVSTSNYRSERVKVYVLKWILGITQSPIQWASGVLSPGIKCPERKADHSLPSSAEVSYARKYTPIPATGLHGVALN